MNFRIAQTGPRKLRGWLRTGLAIVTSVLVASAASAQDRPNVVFIAVDDLRTAIGAYGDDIAVTPNMDKFASDSLLFERAFVQMATCSPSRASLMSAMRPDTLQIYYSTGDGGKVQDSIPLDQTLNGFFKAGGYETISIGKIYHHPDDSKAGWSQRHFNAKDDESQRRRARTAGIESYLAALDFKENSGSNRMKPLLYESEDVGDEAYADGTNTLFAIQELARLSRGDTPFFLALGLRKPHLPFNAPKKYWDLYDPETMPLPSLMAPPENAHPYTLSSFGEIRTYAGAPGRNEITIDFIRKMRHAYYANVSYADAMVGKVLKAIDHLGLADDTIVVVWGDHGFKVGEYESFSKHTNFEIDTRVPLMIRVPGKQAGTRTAALVETIDIFPTLAELTGQAPPREKEGRSFATLIDNPEQHFRNATFQQFYRGYRGDDLMGYAVRSDNFRYVAWTKTEDGETIGVELYDHRNDSGETANIADDPAYASTLAYMEQLRVAAKHGPVNN